MDWKLLATVFATVFIAELGDKTQLATLLFAADRDAGKLVVFLGAAGAAITNLLSPRHLRVLAGLGFVAIGLWTLVGGGE